MESFLNSGTAGPIVAAGVSGFICGVALFYLVMIRTMKHRGTAAN
ncbi:MAG: hypothetical protein ACSHXD_10355 [Marinosulfonomonas sp.]